MIIKVGLTGGIGSGKTTVARIFEIFGIPVFNADKKAKELINHNQILKSQIIKAFGSNAFLGGSYNVQFISEIVFNDNSKLDLLNNIVHPHVYSSFEIWTEAQQNIPYLIMEAAILFESGFSSRFDYTITVNAPLDIRIQRIIKRDNTTSEKVMSIMEMQLTDSERSRKADFIIINDNSHLLIPQVLEIHDKFVSLHKTYNQNGKI